MQHSMIGPWREHHRCGRVLQAGHFESLHPQPRIILSTRAARLAVILNRHSASVARRPERTVCAFPQQLRQRSSTLMIVCPSACTFLGLFSNGQTNGLYISEVRRASLVDGEEARPLTLRVLDPDSKQLNTASLLQADDPLAPRHLSPVCSSCARTTSDVIDLKLHNRRPCSPLRLSLICLGHLEGPTSASNTPE